MGIPGLMIVTSLLLFGSSIMAQTSASLVGTVMDASSGAVLEGAMVSVVGMEIDDATTDADGRFLLPHLSAGQTSLRIALSGYSSVVESIDISSTEAALVQILLPRIDATLDELLVIGRGQGPRTGAAIAEVSRRDDSARSAMDLLEKKSTRSASPAKWGGPEWQRQNSDPRLELLPEQRSRDLPRRGPCR
jgi:hypothetical protein